MKYFYSKEHPSNEQIPSIAVHESIIEHKDNTIKLKESANNKKNHQSEDDSDDDTKMMFKIQDKKQNLSSDAIIPVPLLPPPPSPKNYSKSDADASSSSSEAEQQDEDDPFAIFQKKPKESKVIETEANDLFADWNQEATKSHEQVQESVCSMFICMCLLLFCLCDKSIRGWCRFVLVMHYLWYCFIFHCFQFVARERSFITSIRLLFT